MRAVTRGLLRRDHYPEAAHLLQIVRPGFSDEAVIGWGVDLA